MTVTFSALKEQTRMAVDTIEQHSPFVELTTLQTAIYRVIKIVIMQEELPLQMEQLPVIMCIYKNGFVCQQEIANATFRDKSSVQRTITKLEHMGYLQISRGEDKRKKLIALSPSGRDIVMRVVAVALWQEHESAAKKLIEPIFASLRQLSDCLSALKGLPI